jgi:hypothetical protein
MHDGYYLAPSMGFVDLAFYSIQLFIIPAAALLAG